MTHPTGSSGIRSVFGRFPRWRQFVLNRYVVFALALWGYSSLAGILGVGHGAWKYMRFQKLELGLLLYLFWYLNRIIKPSRWRSLLAAAPLFLAYIGQDIYFLLLGKIFRLIELTEVAELLNIMPLAYFLIVVSAGAGTLFFLLWSINLGRKMTLLLGIMPLVLVVAFAEFFPERFLVSFKKVGREVVNWSDTIPVQLNGRLTMLFFREAERNIARAKTELFHDRPSYESEAQQQADWLKVKGSNKNVHLVLMESFVDPTLFRGAVYTKDPAHPSYRKMFADELGFSISPVFGGKTSQAEFEALCGVPAFQELAGVEFNSFSGAPAYCLPGILAKTGYRTIATNSFKPTFFNAVSAYEGIGFGEMYFPREFSPNSTTYFGTGDTANEIYMFDEPLFSQNLQFIAKGLAEGQGKPILNYVLTMYGHLPHLLDPEKRPSIVDLVSRFRDPQLARVANQYYYRTQAIVEYVEKLKKIDPHSLIIMVSDHLPPLQGVTTYKKLRYLNNQDGNTFMNRILILEDGKVTKYATIHHYDIPKLVLNYLTAGEYCRQKTCGFTENKLLADREGLHDQYLRLMAHAIE